MWRLPKEKGWLASCEQNKLEIVVYDTLDWMEKKFVWVNLELGNKDVFVITSYCNLCDRCTVGWNDMNSPSTPHINPPHPFHPPLLTCSVTLTNLLPHSLTPERMIQLEKGSSKKSVLQTQAPWTGTFCTVLRSLKYDSPTARKIDFFLSILQ